MTNLKNPYEGIENLKRFTKKTFLKYCNDKIHSVDKQNCFHKKTCSK